MFTHTENISDYCTLHATAMPTDLTDCS